MNAQGGYVYGPVFAVIPEVVLYAEVSANAKLLWAILQRHCRTDGGAYPGRRRMAELLRVSEETAKRAKRELVDAGFIRCEERRDDHGRRTTDRIFLCDLDLGGSPVTRGGVTSEPPGGVTSDPAERKEVRKKYPPTPHRTEWQGQRSERRAPTDTSPLLDPELSDDERAAGRAAMARLREAFP